MLITADKLRTLKPEQITKIWLTQVKTLYPTGDAAKQIVADIGIVERTFYNWKKNHCVPWAVVLLFQEWIRNRKPVEPPDPLVVAATEMGKAAKVMAEAMAKRAEIPPS